MWLHRGANGQGVAGDKLIRLADEEQRSGLSRLEGVSGNFDARCCGPTPALDYTCLAVTVDLSKVDLERLAAALGAIFGRAEHLDYDVIVYGEGVASASGPSSAPSSG